MLKGFLGVDLKGLIYGKYVLNTRKAVEYVINK